MKMNEHEEVGKKNYCPYAEIMKKLEMKMQFSHNQSINGGCFYLFPIFCVLQNVSACFKGL